MAGCDVKVFHLSPPREVLHRRIDARATRWLKGRWQDEVQKLLDDGVPADCPGLSILGYREVVSHLEGDLSFDEVTERIVATTRQYAKQQETWFRKESGVRWIRPSERESAVPWIISRFSFDGKEDELS